MAAVTAAVAGGALAAGGAVYSSRQQRKAAESAADAAQPRPFSIDTPYGSAQFDPSRGITAQGGIGAEHATEFNRLTGEFLGGAGRQQVGQFTGPGADQSFQAILNLAGGQLPGALTGAGTNFLGAGQGALAALSNFDTNAFAAEQLQRLNQLARPDEELAASSLADRLFSRGRLGAGDTFSGRAFGELAQAQSRAETERALSAIGLANTERGRLLGEAQGLTGTGLDTILGGQNVASSQIGQYLAALQGAGAAGGLQRSFRDSDLAAALTGQAGIANSFAGLENAINQTLAGAGLVTDARTTAGQIQQAGRTASANNMATIGSTLGGSLLQFGLNNAGSGGRAGASRDLDALMNNQELFGF